MNLSESDLDRLERYLTASERPDSTLPLDATQGLLAAVVSAPAPIAPSRWLPAVLGQDHQFSTPDEARDITAVLTALHDDVARQLNEGEGFNFIFYGGEGEDHDSIAVWCEGYLMGVGLAEPGWEVDTDAEDLDEMLFPFLMLSGRWAEMLEADGEPPMDADEEEKILAELRLSLADDVLANRSYWFERSIPETVRRSTPKVWRNDPCPCGSGKKFKNCCGRASVE
jgi:uncharacterized protein